MSAAALMGVLALQVGSHGQAPGRAQPSFRSRTTLVEVSAVVTRDGHPVADLRADEVTVLDNGVRQPLVAFEYVDLGLVNGPAQRRDFAVVIDNLHIDPTRTPQTIDTALAFIDRLGDYDRVAVVTTGLPNASLDFTTDREAARVFVSGTRGQQQMASLVPGELEMRTRLAMECLARVAGSMRSDAERRSVLLISEGPRPLNREPQFRRDAHNGYDEYLEVIRKAALANVAIYTIDPRGLRAAGNAAITPGLAPAAVLDDDLTGSLAVLALNTGGIQTRWTNDLTVGLSQMIEDSRRYCRIAYAQTDPRPGRKHPETRAIKVKVARDGVHVRAGQRYAPTTNTS
ncbi:VWFA-related Acidobacterial domain protein [Luteitalea pratensis]|uniref:VWFA-related Acidobacterial domain protein n=1 Tax=Luteitalea pratensis TaxID=1855912 RepID=A0A143PN11_LUTPR|nr:VWA domain-containing protein [Luteitalea pratensis]AMY09603.1 VWFA-related Acidobacterial domain protein [Luteitalea pratensis]